MTVFSTIGGFLSGAIVPFLLVLTLIVFIHELGHYLAGRLSGIGVTTFSIGFGPELIGFTDRHGTRWKLALIPLGGFVKFYGDEDAASRPDAEGLAAMTDSERARSFAGAKLWKRAVTVAAGPIANFILAIAIFTVLFSVYGRMVADPVVAEVRAGSAAEAAGLLPGDRMLSFDGVTVETFDDVRRYVSVRPEVDMTVSIERDGKTLALPITPKRETLTDPLGNKAEMGVIGVVTTDQVGKFRRVDYSVPAAMKQGVVESWNIVAETFHYIGNLVTGRMNADQLGGPIRVAQASGQMATIGISALLHLAAMLSVSIGLLNLMPVPVLDGGHLAIYAIEGIRGKPLPANALEIAFRIGMVMLLGLMVFATWNDISALVG